MTSTEFKEIHEAWVELMAIFDEIEALNAEAARHKPVTIAAQKAKAAA
jgi:hypothetical protein